MWAPMSPTSASALPTATVRLKPGHVQPVWVGHPWVYAQAVERVEGGATAGDEVSVVDPRGNFLGRGFYSPGSAIPVRILVRDQKTRLDAAFFRARIESLEAHVDAKWGKRTTQSSHVAQSLPLAPRFSNLPFALVAVPVLALSIAGFTTFGSFRVARGLRVRIAPNRCESQFAERVIVLHITEAGKLFLNFEEEDGMMAYRLSLIYRLRADRTLYLFADDRVPFQKVAEAIDIARSTTLPGTSTPLGINVQLITPGAANAGCPEIQPVPPAHKAGKR